MDGIDILIVGAGPAGLGAAIRAKQVADEAGRELSIAVIDKASAPGNHVLSGAAFEPAILDDLLPGWREARHSFVDSMVPVEREDLMFLRAKSANRIPERIVPSRMHHTGDVVISATRLAQFLAERAEKLGVEVYHGYTAQTLIVEDGAVRGVRLAELGLRADGSSKGNHLPAEEIRAPITILADGTHGVLSRQFAEHFGAGANPQVLSLGMKAIVQFPDKSPFGNNRVMHTLGYPNPPSVFGGGFLYSMGEKTVAVGLILGLDWKYGDLNPQREFETFRAHPYITRLLQGGVTVATGAKTIPEGGLASIGALSAPGGMIVGDGAGFVNMEKIKGLHYAIRSGMCAAETAVNALGDGAAVGPLDAYRDKLQAAGVLEDMRHARNYRQVFAKGGLFVGTPMSLFSAAIPKQLGIHRDGAATKKGARLNRPDPGRMDGATFVALTGTIHREDEPSHITIKDPALCVACEADYANACTHFCPGQVYRWDGDKIVLSPSNCLHCMTCTVKCPPMNIDWVPPEGGEGPHYKQL
jgi:electron-transferring-flavoprotein dehydrogenase